MQYGREDTLEEWYSVLNLEKIPCDESWIYCYDPEIMRQSSQNETDLSMDDYIYICVCVCGTFNKFPDSFCTGI